jgi:prolyl oligopeptidase
MKYPETKKIEVVDDYHGTKVVDNYQWLEDTSKEEVKAWLKKQDELTDSILKSNPLKEKIAKRLTKLWRYDSKSIPFEVRHGKRVFFYEREKEDEHWVYYTRKDIDSEKIELINPNKWEGKHSLSFTKPSSDGKYLAFGKDKAGEEDPVVYVMEVETKKILKDKLTGRKQGRTTWLHDNSGFFYSRKPNKGEVSEGEEHFWDEVWYHPLGTEGEKDHKVLGYEVKEDYHSASVSQCGKYVTYYRDRFGKNEVFLSRIESPGKDELIPIATGFDAEYHCSIIEDKLIIKTDLDASLGQIFITDIDKTERENWKLIIPESKDKLEHFCPINKHLFINYLRNAYTLIKIYTIEGEFVKDMKLPGIGTAEAWGYWHKKIVCARYSSFIEPHKSYYYDLDKNSLELYFEPPIDVDFSKYSTEQVWYKSKDGTKVSMFILKRKDLVKDGNNMTMLTGYGGFGIPMTPGYALTYLIWMENNGVVAIPNLRGGGEYGSDWHEDGKLENKQNSFNDFISAAEWLINEKYTCAERLAISGGSNGGLLMGAVLTQRPDLFKVCKCGVPLLDMLRYHKFRLGSTWKVEYGDPDIKEEFEYIYKYSPYQHVEDIQNKKVKKYPTTLITTGINDARVDPMHALKMVAKMQEYSPDSKILLKVNDDAGHQGGTTISEHIEDMSEEWAFVMGEVN